MGKDNPVDAEIARKAILGICEVLNIKRVVYVDDEISEANGNNGRKVEPVRFSEYFSMTEITPDLLSPDEWREHSATFIGEANDENKTLVFFDQELGGDSGESNGIALFDNLVGASGGKVGKSIICAILTQTTKLESEITDWESWASNPDGEKKHFLLISKDRCEEPKLFASAVKRTVLLNFFEKMWGIVTSAINPTIELAMEDMRKIDPYDFDYMVLASSFKEGVSEAHTLLRLFGIFQRDHFVSGFWTSGAANEFQCLVEIARKVSQSSELTNETRSDNIYSIRRREVVEEGELVNQAQLPLICGDVFKLEEQDLVLVGQPCDMMIRSKGERGQERLKRFVSLVPIKKQSEGDKIPGKPHTRFEIPRYFDDPNHTGYAMFPQARQINVDVLDLAMLNQNGECVFDVAAPPAIPQLFQTGLQKRSEKIIREFGTKAASLDELIDILSAYELAPGQKSRIKETILELSKPGPSWDIDQIYNGGKFIYPFKRIRRIREPFSSELLASYSRFLSRAGMPHDFTNSD